MKKNLKNIENEKTEFAINKGDRKVFNKFIANTDYYEFKIITENEEYLHMDLKAYFKRKNSIIVDPPKNPPPNVVLPPDGEITLKDLTLMVINLNQTVLSLKTSVDTGFAEIRQDIKILKEDVTDIKVRVSSLEKDVAVLKEDVADIKRCPTIQKELSELTD